MEQTPIPEELHYVVEQLYTDRRVNEFLGKMQPRLFIKDLTHHCILEIYRIGMKYPGKIEGLFKVYQLFGWFVGMAKMQLFSPRSSFYRLMLKEFADEMYIDFNQAAEEESREVDNFTEAQNAIIEQLYRQAELKNIQKATKKEESKIHYANIRKANKIQASI